MTFTDDTREIPLTRGQVAIVDAADYEWLSTFKWCAWRSRKTATWYAVRGLMRHEPGFVPPGATVLMHKAIMAPVPGMLVDHRDHNGLNNHRWNLRYATNAQNNMNQRSTRGTSHFLGVTWSLACSKWAAQIKVDGKHIHLGVFTSETDAALARDEASRRYFGEFASLNFPH